MGFVPFSHSICLCTQAPSVFLYDSIQSEFLRVNILHILFIIMVCLCAWVLCSQLQSSCESFIGYFHCCFFTSDINDGAHTSTVIQFDRCPNANDKYSVWFREKWSAVECGYTFFQMVFGRRARSNWHIRQLSSVSMNYFFAVLWEVRVLNRLTTFILSNCSLNRTRCRSPVYPTLLLFVFVWLVFFGHFSW